MTLDKEWEKFHGGPTIASRERLHVTIGKKGVIYMNRNTHRLLGDPSAAYLYFNRVKNKIGIQPASPRMPESFPLRRANDGFKINAAPFCRNFGISIDNTERFIRPDIEANGVLQLDLNYTAIATRPPRKKRK